MALLLVVPLPWPFRVRPRRRRLTDNADCSTPEYVVRKTEIYDIGEDDLQYFLLQKVVSGYFRGEDIDEDSAFVNQFAETTQRPHRQHNGLYPLPLAKTPRHVELKGFMSFIVDENRRIESMSFFPSSIDVR